MKIYRVESRHVCNVQHYLFGVMSIPRRYLVISAKIFSYLSWSNIKSQRRLQKGEATNIILFIPKYYHTLLTCLLGRWKVFFLSGQIYEKCRKTSRVLPAPAPAAGTKMFPTNFSLHTRGDGSLFHISSHLKSHYHARQPLRQHSGSLADILDISWWSVSSSSQTKVSGLKQISNRS